MIWQDILLMVGGFVLGASIIPAIRAGTKVPFVTCLLQATILTSFLVAYLTLHLWLASIAMVCNALAWWILLVRR